MGGAHGDYAVFKYELETKPPGYAILYKVTYNENKNCSDR